MGTPDPAPPWHRPRGGQSLSIQHWAGSGSQAGGADKWAWDTQGPSWAILGVAKLLPGAPLPQALCLRPPWSHSSLLGGLGGGLRSWLRHRLPAGSAQEPRAPGAPPASFHPPCPPPTPLHIQLSSRRQAEAPPPQGSSVRASLIHPAWTQQGLMGVLGRGEVSCVTRQGRGPTEGLFLEGQPLGSRPRHGLPAGCTPPHGLGGPG